MQSLTTSGMQGDSDVARIFEQLGIETHFQNDLNMKEVTLRKTDRITCRLSWDFTDTPDLAQTVVVTCCMLGVPFHFTGLQSLKIKETDRIAALQTELRKLGFDVEASASEMEWNGTYSDICEDTVDTYKDHRMAMAFAPCALKLGSIRINDPMVVTKSYPTFWEDLRNAGFTITECNV